MPIEDKPKRTYGRKGQHNVLVFHGKNGKHEHFWYNSNTGQMGWHGDDVDPELKRAVGRDAARNAIPITENRRIVSMPKVTLNETAAQSHEDFATVFTTAATSLEEDGKGIRSYFSQLSDELGPYVDDYNEFMNNMVDAGDNCAEIMRSEASDLRTTAAWIRQPAGTPRPKPKGINS